MLLFFSRPEDVQIRTIAHPHIKPRDSISGYRKWIRTPASQRKSRRSIFSAQYEFSPRPLSQTLPSSLSITRRPANQEWEFSRIIRAFGDFCCRVEIMGLVWRYGGWNVLEVSRANGDRIRHVQPGVPVQAVSYARTGLQECLHPLHRSSSAHPMSLFDADLDLSFEL